MIIELNLDFANKILQFSFQFSFFRPHFFCVCLDPWFGYWCSGFPFSPLPLAYACSFFVGYISIVGFKANIICLATGHKITRWCICCFFTSISQISGPWEPSKRHCNRSSQKDIVTGGRVILICIRYHVLNTLSFPRNLEHLYSYHCGLGKGLLLFPVCWGLRRIYPT